MNIAVAIDEVEQETLTPASEAGPAPKRIVVAYGFWIFLLSDIVMFSALFAAYAVLVHATAGGPTGAQLFNQVNVAIETACLLASSYTCGLMSLAINSRSRLGTYFFALVTFVLGAAFLALEMREFARHDRPRRDAATQRVSFGLLHPCRLPRFACHRRTDLVGGDDGRRSPSRAFAPPWSGACFALPCSGTRSTSSGSGYSRWSI